MSPVDAPAATDDASVLRRSLVGLVVIAICGLTAELLVERHWGTPVRLVPWFALVALAYAALLLMRHPTAAAQARAATRESAAPLLPSLDDSAPAATAAHA